MCYVEYSKAIRDELRRNSAGLTWSELRERLRLPYDSPCPAWTRRMEAELGLSRTRGSGRAYVWTVPRPRTNAPVRMR